MLDNEKLLFDDLYEKTKDCGRVQFVELLMTKERENKELKLQLKGTTHCFDEEEHEKLKKQLEEANEKILLLKASKPMLEYKKTLEENQQKEFIKFLEDNYKETHDIWYIKILQKYKSIIGDIDENN